ncbi:hypothetical protein IJJ05_00755 [Candidatus Saccharibacteria bacterium]|nr:hypothetical protein [Candidatus Saccharibacteria bacterium]
MPKNSKDLEVDGQLSFWSFSEESKKPKPKSKVEVAMSTEKTSVYWSVCDQMLTSWGPYVGRQDLLDNARDEQTRFKVWNVVEQKFGGSLWRLESRVRELELQFTRDYGVYEMFCFACGIKPASMKWMRSHLWNGDDIASYRSRCRRYKENPVKYPAVALVDLPPRKARKK